MNYKLETGFLEEIRFLCASHITAVSIRIIPLSSLPLRSLRPLRLNIPDTTGIDIILHS